MAGLFSSATLEQIRAASDIVDVIGAVLPLKRAGANFVGLCPFHKEKTPSFNVSPQRQIFHCFGCHKGGDVFRFVQEYENVTFPEAVTRLAERAKIPLEFEKEPGRAQNRFLKDALLDIHEKIAQRWHTLLLTSPGALIARDYLARRGVSADAIKLFRLGYAPEAWDDTVNWAKAQHFEMTLGEQAGLIIQKAGDTRYYDRFRGRLMFPICDEQGRVVAFSGRVLQGDEKTAKYVNSPETPIFTKSKIFYGLDKSKRALLDAQFAVICEGQLDLIACYMGGVQNIVAPQGTAFTADHARILKRYVNEVVLCFDADNAGQSAAVRVVDSLLGVGMAIRVARLPAPHDPDSFIKEKGGAAFAELIQRAPGFFDYFLDSLCANQDLRTDKGQLAVTRSMGAMLAKTGSSVLTDKYAQKTAMRLGVSAQAVRQEFVKASAAGARPTREDESALRETAASALAPPNVTEMWLLKIVLRQDDIVEWLAAHLDLAWVQHPLVRGLVGQRLAAGADWNGPASLLTEMEDEATRSLVSLALTEERPVPNPLQQVSDIVTRLRNQAIDRQIAACVQRASQPGAADGQEHARMIKELQLGRTQPIAPLPGRAERDESG